MNHSRVTQVTLYEDRARVVRTIQIENGTRQQIEIVGLSPWIIDKTIQLNGPGLQCFEINVKRRHRHESDSFRKLENELKKEQQQLNVMEKQRRNLDSSIANLAHPARHSAAGHRRRDR